MVEFSIENTIISDYKTQLYQASTKQQKHPKQSCWMYPVHGHYGIIFDDGNVVSIRSRLINDFIRMNTYNILNIEYTKETNSWKWKENWLIKDKTIRNLIDSFNHKSNILHMNCECFLEDGNVKLRTHNPTLIPGRLPSWINVIMTDYGKILNKELFIGNKTYCIWDFALEGSPNLEKLVIGDNVGHIGTYAFKNCKNLKYLRLPDNLGFINTGAIEGCNNLETLSIYKSNVDIHSIVKGPLKCKLEIRTKNPNELIPDIPIGQVDTLIIDECHKNLDHNTLNKLKQRFGTQKLEFSRKTERA